MTSLALISAHLDAAAASLDLLADSPSLAVDSSQLRTSREEIRLARAALTPLERDLRAIKTLLDFTLAPPPNIPASAEALAP